MNSGTLGKEWKARSPLQWLKWLPPRVVVRIKWDNVPKMLSIVSFIMINKCWLLSISWLHSSGTQPQTRKSKEKGFWAAKINVCNTFFTDEVLVLSLFNTAYRTMSSEQQMPGSQLNREAGREHCSMRAESWWLGTRAIETENYNHTSWSTSHRVIYWVPTGWRIGCTGHMV